MKKHSFSILIFAMFIIGLSVLLYPAISNYINQKHAAKVIANYNDTLNSYEDTKLDELFSKADAYNESLRSTPMSFFEPSRVPGYDDCLDITGNGVMGYIDIDRIGVELPIYHGVSKSVLQIGVGHLPGTSLPVGGNSTHCVLSGHRGLPSAKLFTDLDEMEIGDEFTITVLKTRLTYKVDSIMTVLPSETEELQVVDGKDYCTLMTCTPYGINTHRLLVRGVRIETQETKPGIFVKNEAFRIDSLIVAPIIAIPILTIALVLVFISDRGLKREEKSAENAPDDNTEAEIPGEEAPSENMTAPSMFSGVDTPEDASENEDKRQAPPS